MHTRALVVTHGYVLMSTEGWSERAQCFFFELRRKEAPGHRPRALPMWGVPHQINLVMPSKHHFNHIRVRGDRGRSPRESAPATTRSALRRSTIFPLEAHQIMAEFPLFAHVGREKLTPPPH